MKYIGAHVSIAGGVENAPLNAAAIGAKAFAMFTKNQRQWASPPLTQESIKAFKANCKAHGFSAEHILPHDGYLINLGNPDPAKRAQSLKAFTDEMSRCMQLGLDRLNFHPGSHVGQGVQKGIELICELLNRVLKKEQTTTVLLETMAGKGSEIGRSFEELRAIIDRVELSDKLGICLDTCHVFAAGYDIVHNLDGVLEEFDRILGLSLLRAVHLNDSMMPFDSRKDRHAVIGGGEIGLEALLNVMRHPMLKDLPFYLETPLDDAGHKDEIARLKEYLGETRSEHI